MASERKGGMGLTMVGGAFYIPKEKAGKPQGDDAHFISAEKQTVGVSDGVGGCTKRGIDAGVYARNLMLNAELAMADELSNKVVPARVLNEAYSNTRDPGSATACIVALNNNVLNAVNIGDSGFMVIRDGKVVYKSPILVHSFNYPYQLEHGKQRHNPNLAQELEVAVEAGDVLIVGSDGLFDNLNEQQIAKEAKRGTKEGLDPEIIAWRIAEKAYNDSMNTRAVTPFSLAASKAGVNHFGGKQDDITVVVSYIL